MKKTKRPKVKINPALDKYDSVVLFPKQLEHANRILATIDPSFFKK